MPCSSNGAAMPTNADVEVAGIEASRLQDLHLDDGDVFAIPGASIQRFGRVGPEICDPHIVEIVAPADLLQNHRLHGRQFLLGRHPLKLGGHGQDRRMIAVGLRYPAKARIVEGYTSANRGGSEHVWPCRSDGNCWTNGHVAETVVLTRSRIPADDCLA